MSSSWAEANGFLLAMAKENKIPLIGQFELTARCNQKCKMCYLVRSVNDSKAINSEHSAEEWLKLAKEARDAGMLHLLLTGGEVFVRPDFFQIYDGLCDMGFLLAINTNATLITPEIAKKLGQKPPRNITITIYGASEDTYSKVCKYPQGYNETIRGIKLLLNEGINVRLRTTVVKDNEADVEKLVDFAEQLGIKLELVNYVLNHREHPSDATNQIRLSPEELVSFECRINEYIERRRESGNGSNIKDIVMIAPDEYSKEQASNVNNSAFTCDAGSASFWVSWDGRMFPCGLMNEPYTLPFEIGFGEAWKKLVELCDEVPKCQTCEDCKYSQYCMPCPARHKSETGCFDKPAPYLCEMAKGFYRVSKEYI